MMATMNRRLILPLLVMAVSGLPLRGAPAPANQDETKVPPYTLPNPLVSGGGAPVRDAAAWRTQRRPELLGLFAEHVYGRTPGGRPPAMHWEVTSVDRAALGGKATRKQVTLWFTAQRDGPKLEVLIYQPAGDPGRSAPWPVFLGLNYFGNNCVNADPGIALSRAWMRESAEQRVVNHRATEGTRGTHASRWQVETVLARGYATVTAYYGDLCPDRADGLPEAVGALFGTRGANARGPDEWGAIGMWAWGLSRMLDYVETDRELDARRVAVHGHSRLGKTALWAAAQDERFALAISNDSGCGGAALSKRLYGETVALINASFPHWFARNFRRYDDREADLPVDQHELLALIAPRPLYVASAEGDRWADPRGEFLAAQAAEPVYRLFGQPGLGVAEMPPVNQPVGGTIAYHVRTGQHDITGYDWARYLDFADRHLRRR